MTTLFVGQPRLNWIGQITPRRGEEGGHAGPDDTGAEVLDGLGGLQLLDQFLLVHAHNKTEQIKQTDGKELKSTKKYN